MLFPSLFKDEKIFSDVVVAMCLHTLPCLAVTHVYGLLVRPVMANLECVCCVGMWVLKGFVAFL